MYSSTDPAYVQARAIRLGQKKLAPFHQEVVDWISSEFQVRALDFEYEQNPRTPTYRILEITVAVETWAECEKMEAPAFRARVASKFKEHLRNFDAAAEPDPLKQKAWPPESQPVPEFSIRFHPLEDVQWTLAWDKASKEIESSIKKQFDFVSLIHCGGSNKNQVIYFFTDAQVTKVNGDAVRNFLLPILKQYDEFGIFGLHDFSTCSIVSNEFVDREYSGNYYR